MKELLIFLFLFSISLMCFAFSDNAFNGVSQISTSVHEGVGKSIKAIQYLEPGEFSKPFSCFIYGKSDAMTWQSGFNYGWKTFTKPLHDYPNVLQEDFPRDQNITSNKQTKTLTIRVVDQWPVFATCYYNYTV